MYEAIESILLCVIVLVQRIGRQVFLTVALPQAWISVKGKKGLAHSIGHESYWNRRWFNWY
jgi:hypothetical protein